MPDKPGNQCSNASVIGPHGVRALIIEDDPQYSGPLRAILNHKGHIAHHVTSHDDARAWLRENNCDVIFTDANTQTEYNGQMLSTLDVSSSGEAFLKAGHHIKQGKAIPVVTMSGEGTNPDANYNDDMRKAAEMHDGPVLLQSKEKLFVHEGEGCAALVTEVREDIVDASLEWTQEKPLDVLIIEDADFYYEPLLEAFEAIGQKVTHVTTHDEAVRLLNEGRHFDVAFCDGSATFGRGYSADTYLQENSQLDKPATIVTMSDMRNSNERIKCDSGDAPVLEYGKYGIFSRDIDGCYEVGNTDVLKEILQQARSGSLASEREQSASR